jgi:hypothetical protein
VSDDPAGHPYSNADTEPDPHGDTGPLHWSGDEEDPKLVVSGPRSASDPGADS